MMLAYIIVFLAFIVAVLFLTYIRSVGPCWIKGREIKNISLKIKRECVILPEVKAKSKGSHLLTTDDKVEISDIRIGIGVALTVIFFASGAIILPMNNLIGSTLFGVGIYALKKFIIDELYTRAELICYAKKFGSMKVYTFNYMRKMNKSKIKGKKCPK